MLCSPFAYRAYQKPLGYAGDYEIINMMLRDPCEGASLFAKMLNFNFLNQPTCEAHRNRIKYLTLKLKEETQRTVQAGRVARILNMGCGPAREVQDFLIQEQISEKAEFTLLDFNDETLEYALKTLENLKIQWKRLTPISMVKKSVHTILKDSYKPSPGPEEKRYDFIYCAGLFDYLEDRICLKLMDYFYGLLEPGGLLLATNVTPVSPLRSIMEGILEWPMIYRDHQQMSTLKPEAAPEGAAQVSTESTGVNIFIEVRRPK
jgi:extracellular factor (EF) 3-hydroxypalmitic acid methyl ester biosynthesis protein